MSTDQTPALARATEALWKFVNEETPEFEADGLDPMVVRGMEAHATVSAALHDPDDPDALPKVLAEVDGWGDLWGDLAEVHNRHLDGRRDAYRRRADAVRAALLGGDS